MTTEELTKRLFEIDELVSSHSERIRTLFEQMKDMSRMTESIYKLTVSIEGLACEQRATQAKLDTLSGEVEELRSRPVKRWDGLVKIATTAVVTAIVTYLLAQAGLVT